MATVKPWNGRVYREFEEPVLAGVLTSAWSIAASYPLFGRIKSYDVDIELIDVRHNAF